MSQFRTIIKHKKATNQIDYASKLVLIGSCFTENIGKKLNYFKFENTVNPLGILFHPIAIEKLISRSISNTMYLEDELVYQNERWHCFDAHSVLSHRNKSTLLSNLNTKLTITKTALLTASHVIITLGTAWVYRHLKTDDIVANCHKISQHQFQKELLSIPEIKVQLNKLIHQIKDLNPTVEIIFTVSPIRHIKDGFVANMQSKAHLISAIHQLKTSYFPAFEIMMDDLRDYRFYKADMIHPNQTAINYIWEAFKNTWINPNSFQTMDEVAQIQRGLAHKPFNETSEQHQCFMHDLQQKIDELEASVGIQF